MVRDHDLLVQRANIKQISGLQLTHNINNLQTGWSTMRSKSVRWLLDTVLNDLSEVDIAKLAICASLEAAKRPIFRRGAHKSMSVGHHDLLEQRNRHVVHRFKVRQGCLDHIFHPFAISGAKSRMPMVEDGEFNRHDVSCTSLNSFP